MRYLHGAPKAIVPLIIRWGGGASSDVLRHCARCSKCGRKGASLTAPSWSDELEKWVPFPAERL